MCGGSAPFSMLSTIVGGRVTAVCPRSLVEGWMGGWVVEGQQPTHFEYPDPPVSASAPFTRPSSAEITVVLETNNRPLFLRGTNGVLG